MAWQDDARAVLSAYSCIRLAVVFGSIARGRNRGDSDIAWTDFKAQAMVDWWDWAPTARRVHAAARLR